MSAFESVGSTVTLTSAGIDVCAILNLPVRGWHAAVAFAVAAACTAYHARRRWTRRQLGAKQLTVVTGCDSGLGYSLALHLQESGTTVLAGVLNESGEGAIDLRCRGVHVLPLDLTDKASVQGFVKAVERVLQEEQLELYALVNNAGVMTFGEFEWLLDAQIRQQLEVNVLGTMSVTRRLLPLLRRHSSRLLNVTSHCALEALPGLSVYAASKAALQAWSTSLRVELAKYGVSVVTFIPGSFPNESNIAAHQRVQFEEMRLAMSEEAHEFYGDYFEVYASYLSALSNNHGLQRLQNPKVYETFEAALLDKSPSAVYKCEPWRYTLYFTMMRFAPTPVRDWLVEKFVQMPAWNQKRDPLTVPDPISQF